MQNLWTPRRPRGGATAAQHCSHDAAKESSPSKRGLPRPAGFEITAWTISQPPKASSPSHNAPPPEIAALSRHPQRHRSKAKPRRANRS
jgi:hypothetical protein